MRAILPLLHADQTLYSWCSQVHLLNCGTSARQTSYDLFGAPYAALWHDFPAHLWTLTQRTHDHLGSPRELALHHTLLGYFLPTVEGDEAEETINLVAQGSVPSLKMRLGITASRVGGYHPLKFCPDCVGAEQEQLGYAYWHIEHQYPSCFVCLKHARPLTFVRDVVTPVHRRYWVTPTGTRDCHLTEAPVPSDTALVILARLARDSMRLAALPPGYLTPEHAAGGYQRLLRERGLASRHGSLHIGKVVSLVRERYRGLNALPGMAPLDSIRDDWPGLAAALSRKRPSPGHPLKHLLLIGAITDSWEDFILACETGCDNAPPSRPRCSQAAKDQEVARFKHLVTNERMSITGASKIVGVSTTTGVQWAKRLGIPYVSRIKAVTHARVGEVRRRLARGEQVDSIAMSTGVSISVVNRILWVDERLRTSRSSSMLSRRRLATRNHFSLLCRNHANLPLSKLRKKPGNGYAWLYRNDRSWLSEAMRHFGRPPSRHS